MKKIIFLLILFIIPYSVYGLSNEVDINRDSSITLNYFYDDYDFTSTNVKLYYIASLSNDYNYSLSSIFSSLPLNINIDINEEELMILSNNINNYIEKFNVIESLSKKVENNRVIFSNLLPGLYFVKTDKINNSKYSFSFENALINVPSRDIDGTLNYDVIINSKVEEYTPSNPNTYDNIKGYLYIFVGSIIGIILILVSIIIYNRRKIHK